MCLLLILSNKLDLNQETRFTIQKKTRPRSPNCSRLLRAEPELLHRQNVSVTSAKITPPFSWCWISPRVLTHATGWGFPEAHCFHNTKKGSFPLDHVTYGPALLHCRFLKPDGRSDSWHQKCYSRHWRPAGAYRYYLKNIWSKIIDEFN